MRFRHLLPRLVAATLPLLVLYLVFELFFFKPLLPFLPLRYQQWLPEPLQMLAQPSKKKTMPHDYVLIVGDSYASGWGDWMLSADIGTNPAYATHDLLHEMTGRDVIHCAYGGGSVMEVLVRKTVNRFRYLRKMPLYRPEDPAEVLWFFYEGNDLYDNIHRIRHLFKDKIDETRIRDEAYFRKFLETEVMKSDALYYDVRKFHKRWYYQLPAWRLIRRMANNLFGPRPQPAATVPPLLAEPGTNLYQKAGGVGRLERGDMLCPPMHLSDADFDLSLYMTGECVDYLRDFFPHSKFTIVYIPSVITSYPIVSEKVTVQEQNQSDDFVADTKAIFDMSDRTYRGVCRMAAERSIEVVDMRGALRAAASRVGRIHGPKDCYHLNRKGYEALARAIVSRLKP